MWNRLLAFSDRPLDPRQLIHWSAASSHDSAVKLAALWLAAELGDLPHALYAKGPDGFEPVQVSGMSGAPRFGADSQLEAALRHAGGPVATRRSHRGRRFDAALSQEDREALRAIRADAIVPLSPASAPLDVFVLVSRTGGGFDPTRLLAALEPIAGCLSRLRMRSAPPASDWRPGRSAAG